MRVRLHKEVLSPSVKVHDQRVWGTLRIPHKVISVLAYGKQDDSLSSVTLYAQFRWLGLIGCTESFLREDEQHSGTEKGQPGGGAWRAFCGRSEVIQQVSVGHHVSLSSDYRVYQTSSEIIRTSFRIILIPRISQCSGGRLKDLVTGRNIPSLKSINTQSGLDDNLGEFRYCPSVPLDLVISRFSV